MKKLPTYDLCTSDIYVFQIGITRIVVLILFFYYYNYYNNKISCLKFSET